MAEKKKQVDITNPFEEQLQQKARETFTVDPNAKPPKLGQTFPGSILTGIRDIFNLPGVAIEAANRLQLNLTGNSNQPTKPLYRFTNKNIISGMQGLSAPYRRFVAEPVTTYLIAAQETFRNPSKYFLNPSQIYNLINRSYDRAQGNRNGKEWWEDPSRPVTLGQAFNAVLASPLRDEKIPSLLDVDAVYKYYVDDPDGSGPRVAPGKNTSGALDFLAILFFDPINLIPIGPVAKGAKGATSVTKTVDWSSKGLKKLSSKEFKSIAENAFASNREDIGDFALLLDEVGSGGQNKLLENYVFYGTPEFEDTAFFLKNTFNDYDDIVKKLPGEEIPKIEGLGEVKYFVTDGDAWAATEKTILQWIRPYVNTKGKIVEGYWRESALFPRTVIEDVEIKIVDDNLDLDKTFKFVDSEIKSDNRNLILPSGSSNSNPFLATMFEYSLLPLRFDKELPVSNLSKDLRIPSNALELPRINPITKKIDTRALKSNDTSFAIVFVNGKKTILAYNATPNQESFYFLTSVRKYKEPKQLESEDILARTAELDEIKSFDTPNININELTDKLINGKITDNELEIYKESLSGRYIKGLVSEKELKALEKYGVSFELGKKFDEADEVESLVQTLDDEIADEFMALLTGGVNDLPAGVFDEFDDFASMSAFSESVSNLSKGLEISPSLATSNKPVLSNVRQLAWAPQKEFNLNSIESYETVFYSPFDGSLLSGIVPSNFVIVEPAYGGVGEIARLPQLKKIDNNGNLINDKIYSFDFTGTLTTLDDAKNSYARLKESIIRDQMEITDLQGKKLSKVKRIIKNPRLIKEEVLELPKTPEEYGFWFKIINVENGFKISLIRRVLKWDTFDVGSRKLLENPVDEILQTWKVSNSQMNQINFTSVKNNGYSTDWDLFKQLNSGDETVYTINSSEISTWGSQKGFRIREYWSKVNDLRKQRGAEPIPYDDSISMNYKELIKEQARLKWFGLNRAKVWALQKLKDPNITAKQKSYFEDFVKQTENNLNNLKQELSLDEDLIDQVVAGYPVDISPQMWQAIYTPYKKPEVYLDRFLISLNKIMKTNVSLTDNAISKIDITDSPYPVSSLEEWSDAPISSITFDSPIPKEVLEQIEIKKTIPETIEKRLVLELSNSPADVASAKLVELTADEVAKRTTLQTESLKKSTGYSYGPSDALKSFISERSKKIFEELKTEYNLEFKTVKEFLDQLAPYMDSGVIGPGSGQGGETVLSLQPSKLVSLYNQKVFKELGYEPDDTVMLYRATTGTDMEQPYIGYNSFSPRFALHFANLHARPITVTEVKIKDLHQPVGYTGFGDEFSMAITQSTPIVNTKFVSRDTVRELTEKLGAGNDIQYYEKGQRHFININLSAKFRFDFPENTIKTLKDNPNYSEARRAEINKAIQYLQELKIGDSTNKIPVLRIEADGDLRILQINEDVFLHTAGQKEMYDAIKFLEDELNITLMKPIKGKPLLWFEKPYFERGNK